jgi:hypothetical protein
MDFYRDFQNLDDAEDLKINTDDDYDNDDLLYNFDSDNEVSFNIYDIIIISFAIVVLFI